MHGLQMADLARRHAEKNLWMLGRGGEPGFLDMQLEIQRQRPDRLWLGDNRFETHVGETQIGGFPLCRGAGARQPVFQGDDFAQAGGQVGRRAGKRHETFVINHHAHAGRAVLAIGNQPHRFSSLFLFIGGYASV